MTITPHEFHWYIQALMQKQQLIAFMEKPLDTLIKGSAEYMEAYRFNSYIKLSKVKLNWNKIEVKVRIPEFHHLAHSHSLQLFPQSGTCQEEDLKARQFLQHLYGL